MTHVDVIVGDIELHVAQHTGLCLQDISWNTISKEVAHTGIGPRFTVIAQLFLLSQGEFGEVEGHKKGYFRGIEVVCKVRRGREGGKHLIDAVQWTGIE